MRQTTMQSTAHWTAVIGALALMLVSTIFAIALAGVILRDGNTQEVTDAMGIVGQISQVMAVGIVVLAGATTALSGVAARILPWWSPPAAPAAPPPATPLPPIEATPLPQNLPTPSPTGQP